MLLKENGWIAAGGSKMGKQEGGRIGFVSLRADERGLR
jgi:hypothetical protein